MQNFKQYLQEAKEGYFAPWHDKDTSEFKVFTRNKDGTYNSVNRVITSSEFRNKKRFPIKMRNVKEIFVMGDIEELWGFPDKAAFVDFDMCPNLKHINHIKTQIGVLSINLPNLESIEPNSITCDKLNVYDIGKIQLKDITKLITINSILAVSIGVIFRNRNVLSLCNLPKTIHLYGFPPIGENLTVNHWEEALKVIEIINRNRGDILQCQEDLIDAGLKEYAKL